MKVYLIKDVYKMQEAHTSWDVLNERERDILSYIQFSEQIDSVRTLRKITKDLIKTQRCPDISKTCTNTHVYAASMMTWAHWNDFKSVIFALGKKNNLSWGWKWGWYCKNP